LLKALKTNRIGIAVFWIVVSIVIAVPIVAALLSPQLAWREPVYIAAGLAGVIALAVLFFQPLLAAGYLPGLSNQRGRRIHRWFGVALLLLVIIHVAGLWITSPPDVIDALMFASPTPFSFWGVVAMWALIATACLAVLRRRLRKRLRVWRLIHQALALIIVSSTVVHAMMIVGTMETLSKILLCSLVLISTLLVLAWPQQRK